MFYLCLVYFLIYVYLSWETNTIKQNFTKNADTYILEMDY